MRTHGNNNLPENEKNARSPRNIVGHQRHATFAQQKTLTPAPPAPPIHLKGLERGGDSPSSRGGVSPRVLSPRELTPLRSFRGGGAGGGGGHHYDTRPTFALGGHHMPSSRRPASRPQRPPLKLRATTAAGGWSSPRGVRQVIEHAQQAERDWYVGVLESGSLPASPRTGFTPLARTVWGL